MKKASQHSSAAQTEVSFSHDVQARRLTLHRLPTHCVFSRCCQIAHLLPKQNSSLVVAIHEVLKGFDESCHPCFRHSQEMITMIAVSAIRGQIERTWKMFHICIRAYHLAPFRQCYIKRTLCKVKHDDNLFSCILLLEVRVPAKMISLSSSSFSLALSSPLHVFTSCTLSSLISYDLSRPISLTTTVKCNKQRKKHKPVLQIFFARLLFKVGECRSQPTEYFVRAGRCYVANPMARTIAWWWRC